MRHAARLTLASAITSLTLIAGAAVQAQPYPSRPVTIINQTAAGSGPDVILRILGERLSHVWGQQVVVMNRQGAAGLIAAQAAASAPADGYTLYMPTSTALVILPELNPRMSVDFARDFVPIGLVGDTPMAIAVSASLGISTLGELIAAAKKRPGEMLYAANNRGSVPHLAGAYLSRQAGISLAFAPYPGAPAALNDVLGGRIPIIIESLSALAGAAQDGSIKLLAVTSPRRVASYPELPAVSETIPDFVVTAWFALMAPAATPDGIVQKVSTDLHSVLNEAELRQKLETLGVYARTLPPVDTGQFIQREREVWKPIIREAGLSAP
jgi:tripartite-type tricarboxylate transporter receptor subunit TctC